MPTLTKAIVDWIQTLDSHSIYDADKLAAEYTHQTGEKPCWNTYTVQETRRTIARRGLGGHVSDSKGRCAYGYEVAAALALVFANYRSAMSGRGSLFRDCIEAMQTLLAEQNIESAKLNQSAKN